MEQGWHQWKSIGLEMVLEKKIVVRDLQDEKMEEVMTVRVWEY